LIREQIAVPNAAAAGSFRYAGDAPEREAAFETVVTWWSAPAGGAPSGGDWCDFHRISDDRIALTVGDVMGHGKSASATMECMRSAIAKAALESADPAAILSLANTLAYERAGGVIVTAIVAILDRRQQTFTFASAGHPPPLLVLADGHVFLSQWSGDLPLGIFSLHRAAEYVIALPPDALIALYTDGVTEHQHDALRGEEELARTCRLVHADPDRHAARAIAEHFFRDGRGDDDAAILAVRTQPA
jgi:serine phosphatase RsbU (regulator of sigma subunit)